jgi:Ca2+-binding RTX toxin-like protein
MADARPKLIALVADVSARTQFILPNEAHINSLPFDGIVVNIPASWSSMSPGAVVTEADVRTWLAPLTNFNQGKENYIAVYVDKPADLFDDAAWAQVAANWKVIGKVAAETGFKGVFFDNEEYMGEWQDFPENPTAEETARGVEAYQAMAHQRGREIMTELAQSMPNAKVAFAHGPYLSVEGGVKEPAAGDLQAGGSEFHELRGPFFTGFLEGMGSNQRLIDAGELYALRSASDFKQSTDYRNNDVPGLIDWQVDTTALAQWKDRVDTGHMVYTDTYPVGYTQTPDTLVTTLLNAFDHSEEAVFIYSESSQVPWLTPDVDNVEWIAAVRLAVELVDNTQNGTAGDDVFTGGEKSDRLIGNSGKDTLSGGVGDDFIYGGADSDKLAGNSGNDRVYGEIGDDSIYLGLGKDYGDGGDGFDTLSYYSHSVSITIDMANQNLNAGRALDHRITNIERINGSNIGADKISGDANANYFVGYGGNDKLYGVDGADTLRGGIGADVLSGGAGADKYLYSSASEGGDSISYFSSIDDFQFLRSAFGNLSGPNVAAANFLSRSSGNTATSANHRFIFDQSKDQLWYDSNGSDSGGLTLIATIEANTNLLNTDLLLI